MLEDIVRSQAFKKHHGPGTRMKTHVVVPFSSNSQALKNETLREGFVINSRTRPARCLCRVSFISIRWFTFDFLYSDHERL